MNLLQLQTEVKLLAKEHARLSVDEFNLPIYRRRHTMMHAHLMRALDELRLAHNASIT